MKTTKTTTEEDAVSGKIKYTNFGQMEYTDSGQELSHPE